MQKESPERRRAEGAPENGGLDPAGPGRGFYPGEADDCRRNVCKTPRGCRLGQVVAPGRKRMVRSEEFCLAQTGRGRSEHGWGQRDSKAIV